MYLITVSKPATTADKKNVNIAMKISLGRPVFDQDITQIIFDGNYRNIPKEAQEKIKQGIEETLRAMPEYVEHEIIVTEKPKTEV